MRKSTILFACLLITTQGSAQDLNKFLNNVVERDLESFDRIRITGNFKVTMIKSDVNKIHIFNDASGSQELEFVTEKDKHGVMEVKIEKDKGKEGSDSMDVKIYYTNIVGVDARRGAWIKFENKLEGDSLTFEVASGGHIIAQDITCRSVFGACSKGGSIRLRGTATTAHYNVFAGGEIYAFKLDSEDIWAKIRTGGQISVTSKNVLDCTIFSGGTLMYKGEPKAPNLVKKIAGDFRHIN